VSCPSMVREGTGATLHCWASSKPASHFTWKHISTEVDNSDEPVAENVYNYVIQSAQRIHYGQYSCVANNGVLGENAASCNLAISCTS